MAAIEGMQKVIESLDDLGTAVEAIAFAITPCATPGKDAAGGVVASLTEAVMGITAGLFDIGSALRDVSCSLDHIAKRIN